MSVPNSVEELLQLIRKSGMVDEPKLTGYLQRRQKGRGMSGDPREVADGMVQDGILTNFQAEQFLLGKWRGFTIGKYKLLERIGVGGMGQVFLCEHMFMKRRVAVKVLPPAKAEHPAALGRFYREARAAGSIEHPNIVRTHDIDQDGNLHFIVMQYVDGANLLEIVKKHGAMDAGRATTYMRQVALGLDFAFKNGIIHRDVKPGNILIDRKGTARVLDMGLARFFKDQTDNLTVKYDDKIVLGTADYVAPEQVANSHAVDVRADIYALGATMYFLLAGHPPFPSGTVSQKLLWHRTKDPTPIRQVRPNIPEALAAIVTKMMMKDPAARYQTPGEVADALLPLVPLKVAVPPVEEMPVLCAAVLEGQEETADTGRIEVAEEPIAELELASVGPVSAVMQNRGGPAAGARSFGPAAGPFAPSVPVPTAPFGSPAVSRASGFAPKPLSASRSAAPFGGPQANEPTPPPLAPQPLRAPNGRLSSFQPPYYAMPPAERKSFWNSQTIAMVVLIGASMFMAGGMVYWKFFRTPRAAAVPVQVEPAAR